MFFDCTSWLVSDLIENKNRFSHDEANTHTGSHTLSTLQQNLSSELLLVPLVYMFVHMNVKHLLLSDWCTYPVTVHACRVCQGIMILAIIGTEKDTLEFNKT